MSHINRDNLTVRDSIMGERVRIVGDHKHAGKVGEIIDEYAIGPDGFRCEYGGHRWVNVGDGINTTYIARRENVEVLP